MGAERTVSTTGLLYLFSTQRSRSQSDISFRHHPESILSVLLLSVVAVLLRHAPWDRNDVFAWVPVSGTWHQPRLTFQNSVNGERMTPVSVWL